jgi:hypothetical protein
VDFFQNNEVIWGLIGGGATTQTPVSYNYLLDAKLLEMYLTDGLLLTSYLAKDILAPDNRSDEWL